MRSRWKGPYINKTFIKTNSFNGNNWSRSTLIIPFFIGKFLNIYNGQAWVSIKINSSMVGHKIGEFIATRKKYSLNKYK